MPEIRTARGLVSAYGFACGYVERAIIGEISVSLWHENGCYHVRAHESGFGGRGGLFWDSFRMLGEARKRFATAAGMLRLSTRADAGGP